MQNQNIDTAIVDANTSLLFFDGARISSIKMFYLAKLMLIKRDKTFCWLKLKIPRNSW